MSDEIYNDLPGTYLAELTQAQPLGLAEWHDFQQATNRLMAPSEPEPLLHLLTRGLVRASFSKGFIASCYLDDVDDAEEFSVHEKLLAQGHYSTSSTFGEGGLSREFWSRTSPIKAKEWAAVPSFPFKEFALTNWEEGRFGLLQYPYYLKSRSWGVYIEFYGVKYSADDLAAVVPQSSNLLTNQIAGRLSKYPWDEAMAAFAAIHYKTGVVDDIHAYGALATIEEFLKNWFAARDLWPSESSIRKRARTLLEAYRSVDMNEVK